MQPAIQVRTWWKQQRSQAGVAKTTAKLLAATWRFLRESTPSRRRQRYGDVDYDWEYRVDTTSAALPWPDRLLGQLYSPYQPTDPAVFHEMMAQLPEPLDAFTFVDLGCGKGRTLLLASEYEFRRIVGVELLPSLHAIAQANLARFSSGRQKCFRLEAICGDAAEFAFPNEPSVIYLFNPLSAGHLARVADRLQTSLTMSPRPVYVLYHIPEHDQVFANRRWFRKISGTHQYSIYAS